LDYRPGVKRKEVGSHAFFSVDINIDIQSDATLAGKDPAGIKLPAPKFAEVTAN
jgi:hypothetical protein